jgi:membrane protein DedA with SNARE-associated domain
MDLNQAGRATHDAGIVDATNGGVEFLQSHLDFLLHHLLTVVFTAFVIEAAGLPFPSRILLLFAAALAIDSRQLVGLVAVSTIGSLIGDHVPYLAGALTGPRILAFYCRITLGSAECVEKTVAYFRRYGAAAVLLSRFSAGVRLFASALSGCGHITYWKFVTLDLVGTVVYTTLWVTVGWLVGERAAELLDRHRGARLLLLVGPLALATLIAYRLWRRKRYGPAQADVVVTESASCTVGRKAPVG